MQIDIPTSTLVVLVAVNFALCLYLAWVVSRIRAGLGQGGAADLAVRAEADSEILARVAAEIGVAVEEVTRVGTEAEERLAVLETRCDELAERVADLGVAPLGAPSVAAGGAEPLAPLTVTEPDIPAGALNVADAPGDRVRTGEGAGGYRAVAKFAERHARVCALREQGKGLAEIARITRMSEGEVEFVLGVRDRLPPAALDAPPETNPPD
jgi:hypothetical protein